MVDTLHLIVVTPTTGLKVPRRLIVLAPQRDPTPDMKDHLIHPLVMIEAIMGAEIWLIEIIIVVLMREGTKAESVLLPPLSILEIVEMDIVIVEGKKTMRVLLHHPFEEEDKEKEEVVVVVAVMQVEVEC